MAVRLKQQHAEARRLRKAGTPVKRIAALLGISVSSVSNWTCDIELSAEQRALNLARAGAVRGQAWRQRNRSTRREHQEGGRIRARLGDPLHAAGCMLYWAEGAKGRNVAMFCNSDPAMVRFFCRFIRTCFDVVPDDFTLSLNVYTTNGRSIEEIEKYWLDLLDLSKSSVRKHTLNHFPTSSSGKRANKLPFGVCTVKVKRSTPIVQHIYGAIQEYSGSVQPTWLDGPPRAPTS